MDTTTKKIRPTDFTNNSYNSKTTIRDQEAAEVRRKKEKINVLASEPSEGKET